MAILKFLPTMRYKVFTVMYHSNDLPSPSTAPIHSGRLLLRSLGMIVIPVTSPRSIWELMTVHMERERSLVTRQSNENVLY